MKIALQLLFPLMIAQARGAEDEGPTDALEQALNLEDDGSGIDPFHVQNLTATQFKEKLDDPVYKWFDVVVDARTQSDFDGGHIEGATLVESLASFGMADQVASPDALAGCEYCNVVVYCDSGDLAAGALVHLQSAGFKGRLYNGQGVNDWTAENYPLVSAASVAPPCTVDNGVSDQCKLTFQSYQGGFNDGMPGDQAPASNETSAASCKMAGVFGFGIAALFW